MTLRISNPVRGPLHDNNWVRPAGNTDMRVTKTAAQHVASGGPPALDIGDGAPDLDEILAPRASKVAEARTDGSANLSLDFFEDGKKWRIVLAHDTLPHLVALGQTVSEGQVVDRMGMTGATAIHLHIQVGYWDGSKWVWLDPWPLLAQNQETSMTPIPPGKFTFLSNKQTVTAVSVKFRAERVTEPDPRGEVLKVYPAGTLFQPTVMASDGTNVSGSSDWYGGMGVLDDGRATFGWIHSSGLQLPLVETVKPDVALQAEIAEQQATINSQTQRISALTGAVSSKNAMLDAALLHEKPHVDLSAALQAARAK